MRLSSVNLNLLVALKALLDEVNVTRAAKRLNITQSGMSKNLAQLREIFGDPILVRTGNALMLTERAHELRAGVDAVLADVEGLLMGEAFNPVTCDRRFNLAVTDYVAEHILPDALEIVATEAPNIDVDITLWTQGDVRKLVDGSLDLVSSLVDESFEGLKTGLIGRDFFVCCMREGHPLENSLTLDAYCDAGHAAVTSGGDKVRVVDEFLARHGKSRHVHYSVPLYGPVLEMVRRTSLLTTIPMHIACNLRKRYGLTVRSLPFELPEFEYSVIWHERRDHDASHAWFRSRLLQEIRKSHFSRTPGDCRVE